METARRWLPPIAVVAALCIGYVAVHHFVVIPWWDSFTRPFGLGVLFFGHADLFMALFCFVKSCFLSPGFLESCSPPSLSHKQTEADKLKVASKEGEDHFQHKQKFCTKCQLPKPQQAHHCKVCGKCVLNMNHHCKWINNCVGFRNRKSFCLFVLYSTSLVFLSLFLLTAKIFSISQELKKDKTKQMPVKEVAMISLYTLVYAPLGFGLAFFCWEQLEMICADESYIDRLQNETKSKHEDGDTALSPSIHSPASSESKAEENFKKVFGQNVLGWFFPTTPHLKST